MVCILTVRFTQLLPGFRVRLQLVFTLKPCDEVNFDCEGENQELPKCGKGKIQALTHA